MATLLAQTDVDPAVNVALNVGFGIIATVMIFAAFSVVTTKNVVHTASISKMTKLGKTVSINTA